ncbi:MAG TPA: response regulator [Ramlibacter sp.]|uniref:response regulator n=1 Tax=Ramlibacter sp. TaxID=1917967 RepID=UPI002BF3DBB0|nr:response regulator [Ramlibacter sp.]HVZ43712.1 response regulator [Ramlibacter sp.]
MDVRVFLVEDLGRTRSALADLLGTLDGFRVVGAACTEAEANLWLDEHANGWDLAIVDLMLEQGSGMSVLSRCNAQPGRGRVVVFSGYASPAIREHCLKLGADAVFDKAEPEALMAWCRDLLARENSGP